MGRAFSSTVAHVCLIFLLGYLRSRVRLELVEIEHTHVQRVTLLKGGSQCPMQSDLKVDIAVPLHRVGKEIAVERGVLVEKLVEFENFLGGNQLV